MMLRLKDRQIEHKQIEHKQHIDNTVKTCRKIATGRGIWSWIAELAERTLESPHERAEIEARLARVRETLEAEPALCQGKRSQHDGG
jgi:hypothetical protein